MTSLDDITLEMFEQYGVPAGMVYRIYSGPFLAAFSRDNITKVTVIPLEYGGWEVEVFNWIDDDYETVGLTEFDTPTEVVGFVAEVLGYGADATDESPRI